MQKRLSALEKGVDLEDGRFKPLEFRIEGKNPKSTWMMMSIHEGRNRVIRRLFDQLGHPVSRLIRVAVGGIELGDLPEGKYRHLQKREIKKLLTEAGNPHPAEVPRKLT